MTVRLQICPHRKVLTPKENTKWVGKNVFRQNEGKKDIKFNGSVNICKFIHCSSSFFEIQNLIWQPLIQRKSILKELRISDPP